MKTTGIYAIRHIASGKAYIGSAKWIENRWAVHRKQLREGKHHSPKLQNAWVKYGESAFAFEVIEVTTIATLLEREQFYLDSHRSADRNDGYNVARIAGSPLGFVHGPEMRAKMSAAHKGRKFTDDHRAKISAALKGRRPSENAIAATIARCLGTKQSPEFVEKRFEKLRGRQLKGDALTNVRAGVMARRSLAGKEADVIADRGAGMSIRALSAKYGCSTMPIRRILGAV